MYQIKSQSQEETKETLQESVKNTVCNRSTSSDTWTLPSPHSFFRLNPRKFVRDHLTKGDRLVLNHLVSLSQKYTHVFVSQARIARAIGYTREEVCRIVRRLKAYGLVRLIYRHWQPSIYKLTSLLGMKRVINKIGSFITSTWNYLRNNLTQLDLLVSSKLKSNSMACSNSYLTYNSKRAHSSKGDFLPKLTKPTHNRPPGFRPRYKKRCRAMTKEEIQARVTAIEELSKTLDLSRYGKARLSIFPARAILRAHITLIKATKRGTLVRDPFSFVYECAHKASIELKISLNFSLFDRYKFIGSEEPLNSDQVTLPKEPTTEKGRKMYQAYKHWESSDNNYDYQLEVTKYHEPEKIEGFKETMSKASSIFGEEFMQQNFEAFKTRFTKKAIECHNQ